MSFRVLNKEGEKIIVDKVDPSQHRHLSGREFTSSEFSPIVKAAKKVAKAVTPKKKTLKSKK